MRMFRSLLSVLVLVGAATFLAPAPAAQAATYVCAGSPIPSGYVIVGISSSYTCGSGSYNRWEITIPGETERVCAGSPIPPGYVIVRIDTSQYYCGLGNYNRWEITIPGVTERVCAGSPIPPGYVIVGVSTSQYYCGLGNNNRWEIQRL